MDKTSQEKLIDQVRRYMQNLPLDTHRNNVPRVPQTFWEDIAQQLGKEASTCSKTWKSLRDDYVKAKRKGNINLLSIRPIRAKLQWLDEIVNFDDPKMTVSILYGTVNNTSIVT